MKQQISHFYELLTNIRIALTKFQVHSMHRLIMKISTSNYYLSKGKS
jgi:hypothetical protein